MSQIPQFKPKARDATAYAPRTSYRIGRKSEQELKDSVVIPFRRPTDRDRTKSKNKCGLYILR